MIVTLNNLISILFKWLAIEDIENIILDNVHD
jgi:hypothetical protein